MKMMFDRVVARSELLGDHVFSLCLHLLTTLSSIPHVNISSFFCLPRSLALLSDRPAFYDHLSILPCLDKKKFVYAHTHNLSISLKFSILKSYPCITYSKKIGFFFRCTHFFLQVSCLCIHWRHVYPVCRSFQSGLETRCRGSHRLYLCQPRDGSGLHRPRVKLRRHAQH
jgi:hypothetical protein